MVELRKFLFRLKLLVNEGMTRLVTVRTGFDFLSATFRKQPKLFRSHDTMGYVWPSQRSMQRFRDKVRSPVNGDRQVSLSEKAFQLNRVIRGWGACFRPLNSSVAFHKVDRYVWRKLTRWMRARWRFENAFPTCR